MMTKLYFESIAVECREGEPLSFTWRQKVHRISKILKRWMVQMDWWRQEISRQYYKIECEDFSTYEIYRERDRWFLERLYD